MSRAIIANSIGTKQRMLVGLKTCLGRRHVLVHIAFLKIRLAELHNFLAAIFFCYAACCLFLAPLATTSLAFAFGCVLGLVLGTLTHFCVTSSNL